MNSELKKLESFKRGLSWSAIKKNIKKSGCPVCNIVNDSTLKYISFLLREFASDAEVHSRALKSMGFCSRHSKLIEEIEKEENVDGLNIATIYETVISAEVKHFLKISEILTPKEQNFIRAAMQFKNKKKKILDLLNPTDECFICKNEKLTASFYSHEIIKISNDKDFRETFENSDSIFCREHFILLISGIKDENILKYFVNSHSKKINQLRTQLETFIKKHNYLNKEDLTTNEKEVIERTLNYFGRKF